MQKDGRIFYSQEIKSILKTQGVQGIYRGFWASAWRDIPGWGIYFSSYEWLKEMNPFNKSEHSSEEKRRRMHQLWVINAGGVAGVISWIFSIPQDIVKTMQQTHMGEKPLKSSQALNQLMSDGGVRRIFKGATPTLMRGYLVNMITLPMFDLINALLRDEE